MFGKYRDYQKYPGWISVSVVLVVCVLGWVAASILWEIITGWLA